MALSVAIDPSRPLYRKFEQPNLALSTVGIVRKKTRPLTQSFIRSFTRSLTGSFIMSFTNRYICNVAF